MPIFYMLSDIHKDTSC